MNEEEQRPGKGPPEGPGEAAAAPEPTKVSAEDAAAASEPTKAPTGEAQPPPPPAVETEGQRQEGVPRFAWVAGVSGAVLLFALAFFMAGFWAHALLEEDDGDGETTTRSAADDPAWGPEDALVTIEEFGDFQCPYCGRFARETLPKIRAAYGDKIRYVFRDFPITSIHEFAQKAAEAAQCAHQQGLFWEYHDLLFEGQDALAVSDLKQYAEQVGADMDEFNECLDSSENLWEVFLDARDGRLAGVTGTPAFLINGVLLPGAVPFEQFQIIIDQALANAGD